MYSPVTKTELFSHQVSSLSGNFKWDRRFQVILRAGSVGQQALLEVCGWRAKYQVASFLDISIRQNFRVPPTIPEANNISTFK